MANTVLTTTQITRAALRSLKNNSVMAKLVTTKFEGEFGQKNYKIGDSLTVRKPPKYVVNDGPAITIQDAVETSVVMSVNKDKNVSLAFTEYDKTLKIEDFTKRFIDPAIIPLANQVDYDLLQLYKDIYSSVGTPGSHATDLSNYLLGGALLSENGCPTEPRAAVIGSMAQAKLVNGLSGLFNSAPQISEQNLKGRMGEGAGFDFYMDQNIATHTQGQQGGTPLVNGATAEAASSIVSDGWTAAAANRLKKGDIFTLAGVYAVNPQSKASTGALQQFVATADAASDGAGNLTVSVSPSLYTATSGGLQNVSALPADNAAITVVGAASTVSKQQMLFHKDAFGLVMVGLEPGGAGAKTMTITDPDTGLTLNYAEQYDISNRRTVYRIDAIYAVKTLYAELAARLQSA
jgi:hypothetical protein